VQAGSEFWNMDIKLAAVSLAPDSPPLTLTYKIGGGTVRGAIDRCNGAHVFLIPADPALRRDQFIRLAACRANGQFEFSGVRPGEYYGVAVTAAEIPLVTP